MGQIIIDIPQNEVYVYRIQDIERAKKVLSDLGEIARIESEEADEDILGLWTTPKPIKRAAKQ